MTQQNTTKRENETMTSQKENNDLVLIGYGIGTWTPRRATEQEISDYEVSKQSESFLDAAKLQAAFAAKVKLDELTNGQ